MRLRGYNHAQPGKYFATLCTQDRDTRFGDVVGEVLCLNSAGAMVDELWRGLPARFPTISLGPHVLMPNHLHALVVLGASMGPGSEAGPNWALSDRREDSRARPYIRSGRRRLGSSIRPNWDMQPAACAGSPALGGVIRWLKTMTTNAYIRRVREGTWPPFRRRLWQRNYWEHIVRNEADLGEIIEYIGLNPAQWEWDRESREAMRRLLRRP